MSKKFYKKRKRLMASCLLLLLLSGPGSPAFAERNMQLKTDGQLQKLSTFLQSAEKQYNVTFVYDAAEINLDLMVPVTDRAQPMEKALSHLTDHNIAYSIVKNKVVLKKAPQPVRAVQQDTKTVTGVVALKGNPGQQDQAMPGVVVMEKGTSNGTATDVNGKFSLKVKQDAVLVVSMLGYKAKEVSVAGGTVFNIVLEENANELSEIVVTGYQDIDKRLFTGSSATLQASEVKTEGIVDVSRMLEGRVAGVSVQNVSGTFGAAPKVRVRGATSISGENKPLWVIDGVILEDIVNISNDQLSSGDATTLIGSSVAGINAEDIESFNILKDASATALYGARAMNGVVVITTKKGRIGKPVVTYSGNYSTTLKPSYDTYNIMNSADQMSVYSELFRKGLLNGSIMNSMHGGVFAKMYHGINTYDETSGKFGIENTPEGRAAFLNRYARVNTDWFDLLFRNSFVQEHSISVSSGTDKSQHYVSGSFYNDNGWTVADNVKRYTMNMRGNYNLSDRVTAGIITTGSIRDQRAPGTLGRTSNVVEGNYTRDFDINPFSYALNTSRTLAAYDEFGNPEYFTRNYAPFNILNELENNYIDLNMLDLKLQGELGIKLFKNKNLEYKALGSIRYVKTSREHIITEYSNMAEAYRSAANSTIRSANIFLYNNPDRPWEEKQIVLPEGGFYNRNEDFLVNYYVRNTLNWNNTFDNRHIVNVLAGQEIKYADRQNSYFNGYGYQYDKGGIPFTDYRIIKQMLEGNYNYYGMNKFFDRYASFFTNASYSYDGKYIINGTVRYDGSNRMGASKTARWLPTWTISGAWNVDSEPFMQGISNLDFLKLRATYGLTASMGNATNSSVVLLNSSSLRPTLSEVEPRIVISSLENSELTWEKQYEKNIGFDLGLLGNAVNFSFDAYQRNGFDLIGTIRTSGIGGQTSKQANYADMESHGLEVTLGNRIYQDQNLTWRTNLTFGYNKNKITNLKNLPRIYDLVIPEGGAFEGGAVRGLYSIIFTGLNPNTGTPTFINENGEVSGNVYVQSTGGTAHLKYEGSVDPIMTGGFSNTVTYKNFTFNAFMSYQGGNKIRLNPTFKAGYSDVDAMPKDFLDRWTLPGDEGQVDIPAIADYWNRFSMSGTYPYSNYNYTTARVADGSFVRLKSVSMMYSMPERVTKAMGFNSLSFSLVGTNLWLIHSDKKLKGQDPELYSSGGVALPTPKQVTLSVKVGI
ncbi:SusC/RagA family TonB-linked outer membrane protein [Pontibacter burrus]|uniref:SusC/RagA family TonB-linked outer membrane protein n=1 Tax=Pontibacter burrus TaxID=2704466 RepID=A0A6B3LWL9_9BACT|nr:SusC/RagA family TonB-linked outer membrane protein [Pontibacter burrus]NEM97841.1 SusC/RagA family TonB-linked outer membrane protein [Pontibacter burrus]